jgi:hypothetical protein
LFCENGQSKQWCTGTKGTYVGELTVRSAAAGERVTSSGDPNLGLKCEALVVLNGGQPKPEALVRFREWPWPGEPNPVGSKLPKLHVLFNMSRLCIK